MVPQLARVFPRRDRVDDRPKEAPLPIDRERWHTEGFQPFHAVLVLSHNAFFHPWLGCCFSAPGRVEPRFGQGTLDHRWIAERLLAFVTSLAEGHIETADCIVAKALARPG